MKTFPYTVRGHWPFPVDMLRHDGSRAASDADQILIDRLSAEHTSGRDDFNDVEINLIADWKPNSARWESFGWAVPGDREHAFYKAQNAKARARKAIYDGAMAKLTAEEREAVAWMQPEAH